MVPSYITSCLLGFVFLVSGCPQKQEETKPLPSDTRAPEFQAHYDQLSLHGDQLLKTSRDRLDEYCRQHGAVHHSNMTFISCGRNLHENCWEGEIHVTSSLTVKGFTATYLRELTFIQNDQGLWSEPTPSSSSASLEGDPPADVRRLMKGFSDLLKADFPDAHPEEEPWY